MTEQQWLKMYQETVHPLYGYMAKRTGGNRELTEDIVQESYLRAFDNWNRKTLPDSPVAWLKRVARKVMIDKIQKRLDLRKRFLSGEITAREVELEGRLTAAANNFHLAQSKVDSLKEQLNRLQALETQGTVSHMEVKQLEFALDAAKAELKLATHEMDVLKKVN